VGGRGVWRDLCANLEQHNTFRWNENISAYYSLKCTEWTTLLRLAVKILQYKNFSFKVSTTISNLHIHISNKPRT